MRDDIKGVAFDLDGTLYPNYRLNVKIFPFILKEWQLMSAFGKARIIIRKEQEKSLPQGDFYLHQAKITAGLLSNNKKQVDPEQLNEKIERLIYRGWEPLFKNIKLFKNVSETLLAFKNTGYKMGLLSDFPPEAKLENLGISGNWDAVLCSERSGALKPHPLSFLELAEKMSLPPEKIIYVGNSHSYDVIGAARAGMKTALIKSPITPGSGNKKPKPDFSFYNYRQLYDFMIQ